VVGFAAGGRARGRRFQRRLNSMQNGRKASPRASGPRLGRCRGSRAPRGSIASPATGYLARSPAGPARANRPDDQHRQIRDDCDRSRGAVSDRRASGTGIGIVPSLVIGLLIGAAVPHFVIGRMGKRRLARFITCFRRHRLGSAGAALGPSVSPKQSSGQATRSPIRSAAEFRLIESGMRMDATLKACFGKLQSASTAPEFGSL